MGDYCADFFLFHLFNRSRGLSTIPHIHGRWHQVPQCKYTYMIYMAAHSYAVHIIEYTCMQNKQRHMQIGFQWCALLAQTWGPKIVGYFRVGRGTWEYVIVIWKLHLKFVRNATVTNENSELMLVEWITVEVDISVLYNIFFFFFFFFIVHRKRIHRAHIRHNLIQATHCNCVI